MTGARQVTVDFIGDTKQFSKATTDAVKQSQSMVDKIKKQWSSTEIKKGFMQGLGLGAGLGAFSLVSKGVGMVTDAIGGAINAASDLSETQSKLDQVFKTSAGSVRAWAKDSATSMGLSQQAALEATATFGNFLEAMGQTEPVAAAMSEKMVQLAADLGAFNNIDPAEALDALRSGLTGEVEPLRKFGVDISDAAVKAELLKEGLKAVHGQFTQSQKIQGRYALIMKQTAAAQGNFVLTSGNLAEKQKILDARVQDLAAHLGGLLIGPMTAVVGGLADLAGQFDTSNLRVDAATRYINDYGKAADTAAEAIKHLNAVQQDSPLQAFTKTFDLWVQSSADGLQQETLQLQALNAQGAGLFDIVQWMTDLNKSLAFASGAGAEALGTLAQKVALAGGSFDDFVMAVQGVAAAGVDLRGIAEHYHRSFTTIGQAATDTGAIIGPGNPKGPAAQTKMTVRAMHKTLEDASGPWKAEWQKLANWAKNPFRPDSFENWLHARIREAIKKANDSSLDGATRKRWAHVAALMKNPVVAAGLKIGLTVDQALADIALVTSLAKSLGATIAGIVLAPLGGLTGHHYPKPKPHHDNQPPTGPSTGTRASGGPVQAGGTYLVGEKGPERLTMGSSSGYITPNNRLGGGNSYSVTVNVAPGGDLVEAGRQMVRAIQQYERRSGKAWRRATPT